MVAAAILGFEEQKRQIDVEIAELRAMDSETEPASSKSATAPAKRAKRDGPRCRLYPGIFTKMHRWLAADPKQAGSIAKCFNDEFSKPSGRLTLDSPMYSEGLYQASGRRVDLNRPIIQARGSRVAEGEEYMEEDRGGFNGCPPRAVHR